jgi:hypothetical protein
MPKVSFEDCVAWATPSQEQLTKFATSEAELMEITEFVTQERRRWLIETCFEQQQVLTSTAPLVSETSSLSFSDIPAKFVLTHDNYHKLVADANINSALQGYGGVYMRKGCWLQLAGLQAELIGHSLTASKYDKTPYTGTKEANKEFRRRLKRSQQIIESGYPIRFLMDGVRYVQQSALDLDTVQDWADVTCDYTRRKEITFVPVYNTPYGFWKDMLAIKRDHDDKNNIVTFADQVEELDEGLYLAEYLPATIQASGEYLTVDDVIKIVCANGNKEATATLTFKAMILHAIRRKEVVEKIRMRCFAVSAPASNSGTLILHKDRLTDVIDAMHEYDGNIIKTITMAELVVSQYNDTDDDYYNYLVFGS